MSEKNKAKKRVGIEMFTSRHFVDEFHKMTLHCTVETQINFEINDNTNPQKGHKFTCWCVHMVQLPENYQQSWRILVRAQLEEPIVTDNFVNNKWVGSTN